MLPGLARGGQRTGVGSPLPPCEFSRVQSQVFRLDSNIFTLEPSHQLLANTSK